MNGSIEFGKKQILLWDATKHVRITSKSPNLNKHHVKTRGGGDDVISETSASSSGFFARKEESPPGFRGHSPKHMLNPIMLLMAEIRRSPVEVGSLSHYVPWAPQTYIFRGFYGK